MDGCWFGDETLQGWVIPSCHCTRSSEHKLKALSAHSDRLHVARVQAHRLYVWVWTTGCVKAARSASVGWMNYRAHKHALSDHSPLKLNKYQGPSIHKDRDAVGNFHCPAVTRQQLEEWLREGREELTHSCCDVNDAKAQAHTLAHKHTRSLTQPWKSTSLYSRSQNGSSSCYFWLLWSVNVWD